jgi:outer membrane protein assembly factor BamB
MKKAIVRNIAIVSGIFIVTLSIMIITSYFQVRETPPLQTEVLETLKQLNDENVNNPALQEQIRELDLLARKAYFVRIDYLMNGIYILIGMLAVLIICLRFYFAGEKNVPEKELDPVDEWVIQTNARKYVGWGASGLVVVALIFAALTSPYLFDKKANPGADEQAMVAGAANDDANGAGAANDGTNEADANRGDANEDDTNEAGAANDGTNGGDANEDDTNEVGAANDGANEAGTNEADAANDGANGGSANGGGANEAGANEAGANGAGANGAGANGAGANGAGANGAGANGGGGSSQSSASNVTHNAFRGNNSNGISTAKGVPVKWDLVNGTNIAWKQDIPRKGFNSPVINGNRIFFTGADEQTRELYCYDLNTGEKRWTLTVANIPGSPAQAPKTTEDTGLAASTVATNGKQVCAIFATGDIICADTDGKQLWAKNLGMPDNHYGYASSLLTFGNLVIVQYDNRDNAQVIAMDIQSGAVRWSKERKEKITWSSPILADVNNRPQLILMGNPSIIAYNPDNGEQLWNVECLSGEVGSSPCSANGVVFGASEYAKLVAINGADGKVLWEGQDFLPEVSSPVATRHNVYLATSYGVVAAYNAQTGELRKDHELNTEFYSSPVIAEGKVYLFSNEGKMHIFSADDNFSLLDAFETGEKTFATPAFTDGKIVVRTEKSLYCVLNK